MTLEIWEWSRDVYSQNWEPIRIVNRGLQILTIKSVCNPDKDHWAPDIWTVENCAYTGLSRKDEPPPVSDEKETYTLLNSGLFVFVPSEENWTRVVNFLSEDERVRTYKFPDQVSLIPTLRLLRIRIRLY